MRVSTYETFAPIVDEAGEQVAGQTLLINGLYGAMDVVDDGIARKLLAEDFDHIPLAQRERLFSRGHLTRKDAAGELDDLKLLAHLHRTLLNTSIRPVIIPTYDCNFRCPYCFEDHRLAKGQDWLDRTMTLDTLDAVFAGLQDYRDRGYKIEDCTLYGGEPLLAKNRDLVYEIGSRARDMGLGIEILSNGYELDAFLDFIAELPVTVIQFTIDGVGAVNDCLRRHKSGVGTYERILANMERTLDCGVDVELRMNVSTRNLDNIGELVDDLTARGFIGRTAKGGGAFDYYLQATHDEGHPENNIREQDIFDELVRVGLSIGEAIERDGVYRAAANAIMADMRKDQMPGLSPRYCGAEAGELVFDPMGDIYSCWNVVGNERAAVGFVDDEAGRFMWNFNKARWRTRTVDRMEKCQSCPFALICRGGCGFFAQVDHGDCFREYCGEIKDVYPAVASRLAGRAWLERGEGELSLSLATLLARLTEAERAAIMGSTSQKEVYDIVKPTGFALKDLAE